MKSKPAAAFKIFKDGKELKANDRVLVERVELSEISFALTIKNVEASDAGSYKVTATNKVGVASSETIFNVTGAACFIRKPNFPIFLAEKKSTKIEFEVAGIPLPEVQW